MENNNDDKNKKKNQDEPNGFWKVVKRLHQINMLRGAWAGLVWLWEEGGEIVSTLMDHLS